MQGFFSCFPCHCQIYLVSQLANKLAAINQHYMAGAKQYKNTMRLTWYIAVTPRTIYRRYMSTCVWARFVPILTQSQWIPSWLTYTGMDWFMLRKEWRTDCSLLHQEFGESDVWCLWNISCRLELFDTRVLLLSFRKVYDWGSSYCSMLISKEKGVQVKVYKPC
jgi:hypothetical protein